MSLSAKRDEKRVFRHVGGRRDDVGDFNVMNTLCAVTAMRGRVDDEAIIDGVANVPQVPGRLERIDLSNGAFCFVDFAHTPSALKSVLKTIKKLSGNSGRIISVFGHGGGRYKNSDGKHV